MERRTLDEIFVGRSNIYEDLNVFCAPQSCLSLVTQRKVVIIVFGVGGCKYYLGSLGGGGN